MSGDSNKFSFLLFFFFSELDQARNLVTVTAEIVINLIVSPMKFWRREAATQNKKTHRN